MWTHRIEPNVILGKPVVQETRDTGHADTCGVRRSKMEEMKGDGATAKDVATETVEHWKQLALTAPQYEDDPVRPGGRGQLPARGHPAIRVVVHTFKVYFAISVSLV